MTTPLTKDFRDELQSLSHAVAKYIIEMDEIMKGPSTYERGRALAQNLGNLQVAWEDAEAVLNPPKKTAKAVRRNCIQRLRE